MPVRARRGATVSQPACIIAGFQASSTGWALTSHSASWTCPKKLRHHGIPGYGLARTQRVSCFACATPPPADAKGEEEETLDELAMRAAEIHEVLKGLEDFKARIIDDATKLAKKVRASKKELQESLENHPDIIKIDGHLKELKEELEQIGDR